MKNEKELVETIFKMKSVIIEAERLLEQIKQPERPKFKRGDFVYSYCNKLKSYAILLYEREYIDKNNDLVCDVYCAIGYMGIVVSNSTKGYGMYDTRLATDSEKQLLLDKLHEQGKYWDAEKMEIVDYIEKIEEGDIIYEVVKDKNIFEVIEYIATHSRKYGNFQFKTEELAKEACDKLNEVLKTLKHF